MMSSGYVSSNDARLYCIGMECMYTYRRGLQCCLFRIEGHARTSDGGTAIVQSRFFAYLIFEFKIEFFAKCIEINIFVAQ